MKRIVFTENLDIPVIIDSYKTGKFTVTYGTQRHSSISYARAAEKLGEAIMHSLACAGNHEEVTDDAE